MKSLLFPEGILLPGKRNSREARPRKDGAFRRHSLLLMPCEACPRKGGAEIQHNNDWTPAPHLHGDKLCEGDRLRKGDRICEKVLSAFIEHIQE